MENETVNSEYESEYSELLAQQEKSQQEFKLWLNTSEGARWMKSQIKRKVRKTTKLRRIKRSAS